MVYIFVAILRIQKASYNRHTQSLGLRVYKIGTFYLLHSVANALRLHSHHVRILLPNIGKNHNCQQGYPKFEKSNKRKEIFSMPVLLVS